MEDTELPDKMEEIQKTIQVSTQPKGKYAEYSDNQKVLFVYCLKIKLLNAAASARKAAVNIRTAQDWANRLRKEPDWNIFEKQTNKIHRKKGQL